MLHNEINKSNKIRIFKFSYVVETILFQLFRNELLEIENLQKRVSNNVNLAKSFVWPSMNTLFISYENIENISVYHAYTQMTHDSIVIRTRKINI